LSNICKIKFIGAEPCEEPLVLVRHH